MKCPSEIELHDYAEDRLATERRWEVARHLQDCPACRMDLEGLQWATAALARAEDLELGEEEHVTTADLAALREGKLSAGRRAEALGHLGVCPECATIYGQLPREQRTLPLVRHWQPVAAAASLLIVIGLVFFVARGQLGPGTAPIESAPPHVVERAAPPVASAAPEMRAKQPGGAPSRGAVAPTSRKRVETAVGAARATSAPRRRHEATPRAKEILPIAPAALLARSPEMRVAAMDIGPRGTPPAACPISEPATRPSGAAAKTTPPAEGLTAGAAPSVPAVAVPKGVPVGSMRALMAPSAARSPGGEGTAATGTPPAVVEAVAGHNAIRLDAGHVAQFFSNSARVKARCKAAH